jgi:antitoxin (DNA-binding transcriptional repressor) of toxin-antitoxin stability system
VGAVECGEATTITKHGPPAAGVLARGNWGVSKIRALGETTFLAGLRKAGMPEE